MKWKYKTWVLLIACGLLLCPGAFAQQGVTAGQVEELKQGQEELKQEMTALKGEVQRLRSDLAQITAMLKQIQAGQKPAQQTQRPAMTMVGKEAPKFVVTTFDGKKATLGGQRDKPQVAFFYASWCGYCRKALPWIESLHKNYEDKGVEILAVNLDSRGEGKRDRTVEQTLQQYEEMKLSMPMTTTTDTNDTRQIGEAYKARSFPTLFVLGKDGVVESAHIGAKQGLEQTVGGELDLLLQGKKLPKGG